MVTRLIDQFLERIVHKLNDLQLIHSITPIRLFPEAAGTTKLQEVFDGFLLATPKHRTPIRKIWSRKYGDDNWRYGTKLFKSKRNIITCMECGNFHEVHTICRACFEKTQEKSKEAIEIKANTLWFETNLAQPSVQTKKTLTGSPTSEPLDNTIKVKE